MQLSKALLVTLVIAGCGVNDAEQRAKMNQIPISVDPPGGAYAYRPWVTAIKESTEKGTGTLVIRAPGDAQVGGALFGPGCQSPFYIHDDGDQRQKGCVEVRRTGELHFYLDSLLGAESDVRGVWYTISLPRTDAKAGVKDPVRGVPGAMALPEVDTVCRVGTSDEAPTLHVAIAVDMPKKLRKKWPTATVELSLPKPVTGKKYKFDDHTQPQSGFVSVQLAGGTSEAPLPVYESGIIGYDYDLDTGTMTPKKHAGRCTVTMAAWTPGAISHGTYACTGLQKLRDWDEDTPLLGKTLDVAGDWYCDGYSR